MILSAETVCITFTTCFLLCNKKPHVVESKRKENPSFLKIFLRFQEWLCLGGFIPLLGKFQNLYFIAPILAVDINTSGTWHMHSSCWQVLLF